MNMFDDIYKSLNNELELLALFNSWKVIWPNTDIKYTDAYIVPNLFMSPELITNLKKARKQFGIYEIQISVPADTGTIIIRDYMDKIYNHFLNLKLTNTLTEIVIQEINAVGAPVVDKGRFVATIQINFKIYS